MNEKAKQILADLFMIDPELKKYEKEVEQAVVNMMSAKPDTKFDESFATRLKAELALRAKTIRKPVSFFGYSRYVAGAGALALVVLIAFYLQPNARPGQTLPGILTAPKITE